MSRRGTGVALLGIAGLLYAARYIAAAIFGSNVSSWNRELFQSMLDYVGDGLITWAIVALVAGLLYLAWAEFEGWRQPRD